MGIASGLWAGAKAIMGAGAGSGGENTVMEVARGVGNYIDEQEFTSEEKAVHNGNMIIAMGGFMENTVSENTQRSKTRRDIALLVMRWALLMLTVSAVMWRFDKDWAIYIRDLVVDDPMGWFLLGVGAFFFGAHIVRAMKK